MEDEVWVQTVIPSSSQITEDSLRSDAEPKSQANTTSSVPLPGSVTAYLDEMQVHPSCAIKSIMTDEETGQVETEQEESWLNKLGINRNKLAFFKCLIGWKGNKTVEKVDSPNIPGLSSHDNHRLAELDGCMAKEEQPYIPYKLAKLYITKIVKDMQQMKIRHLKVIKELDCIRKENQEQALIALKNHHSGKMKILKARLEAYQELVNKKNRQWHNTTKSLREKNGQLSQENKDLLYQIKQQNEKWMEEKTWILESFSQKLDHLYTQHSLTLQELQRTRLDIEKVHEIVNLQMDFPQQKALVTSEERDVSGILEAAADQMNTKWKNGNVVDEEHEHLLQKELLWKAQATLEMAKQSLHKREREVAELLQNESGHNKTMKPQVTVTTLLKTLVSRAHTIYCDVPEARQCISQLIEKNDAERAERKVEFNNAQADILSFEVIYGNKATDYKRYIRYLVKQDINTI
ncbi:interaptin-like [Emydura macquarii macquarii]|uniref:interaptin-like n=1 Tax=Emydura macquarii macquarii TaxID=1129001 RepID=UPI00352AD153